MNDMTNRKPDNHDKRIVKEKHTTQKKGNMGKNAGRDTNKRNDSSFNRTKNNFMIPVMIIMCIIPFLIRAKVYDVGLSQFAWFSSQSLIADLFLYYKQWAIIIVSVLMSVIIIYKVCQNRTQIRFTPIFIPVICYAVLALLSSIFSDYPHFSFFGSFEQFESVFALLGYFVITYYVFVVVKEEYDVRLIMKYLIITAVIMSVIGILQFIGYDPVTSKLFYQFIIPDQYKTGEALNVVFGKHRVYLTLFNPNYVGVYVTLVLPIIMFMTFYEKNLKKVALYVITIIGLVICLVGAQSLSGLLGIIAAFLLMLILTRKYIIKYYYIAAPLVTLLVIAFLIIDVTSNHIFTDKLMNTIQLQKTEYPLTDISTNEDDISIVYKGNTMRVQYVYIEGITASIVAKDKDDQDLETIYNSDLNSMMINDDRFKGIALGIDNEDPSIFYVLIDGKQWYFTNNTDDGTYYHMNRMNKLDKIVTAPSALFTGYEPLASNRGYIWSRTIPLLKKHIFLGSGQDTFVTEFPQQDYVYFSNLNMGYEILSKPHNLYLQIGVQSGVLALIAFIVFYLMYFISSIRLYFNGNFNNIFTQMGAAILISTFGYMITGLANDSSVTTAPIFWALMGVGISINYKVKTLAGKRN